MTARPFKTTPARAPTAVATKRITATQEEIVEWRIIERNVSGIALRANFLSGADRRGAGVVPPGLNFETERIRMLQNAGGAWPRPAENCTSGFTPRWLDANRATAKIVRG